MPGLFLSSSFQGGGADEDKKDDVIDPLAEVAPRRQRRNWDEIEKEKEKENDSGASLAPPLRGSGIRKRVTEGGGEGEKGEGEGEGDGRAVGGDAAERRAARRRALGIE